MSGVIIPFRPRSEVVPSSMPIIRTEVPRDILERASPITVEAGIQFMELWGALQAGGFEVVYDQRTSCFLIRKKRKPGDEVRP